MDPKRTFHASQAVHMSDLLNLRFAKERFGTARPRYLRVREPDGPSTAGGRRARQAIILIDFHDDARSTLVCGFVDSVAKKAELRGFAMVKHAYEQRFGTPIDISRGEYKRMMSMLQDFMAGQGIETRLVNDPPPKMETIRPRRRLEWPVPDRTWVWSAVAFGLGFATCYGLVRAGYL